MSKRSVKPLQKYCNFCDFLKMVAAAILDFQKFEILAVDPVYGVYALPCQISSKSIFNKFCMWLGIVVRSIVGT